MLEFECHHSPPHTVLRPRAAYFAWSQYMTFVVVAVLGAMVGFLRRKAEVL